VAAIQSAYEAGITRQRIELLLPLIGATDLDDCEHSPRLPAPTHACSRLAAPCPGPARAAPFRERPAPPPAPRPRPAGPGGIRQQFKAAAPLVEQILRGLKETEGLKGPLGGEIWDDGDAVGAWAGDNLAAVLFPTAPTLERLQKLTDAGPKLVVIVNPQWEVQAGLTSDFGFGDRKRRRLEFVDSFRWSYSLKTYRVQGDEVRVLYAHPGQWRIFVVPRGGAVPKLLATMAERPSYRDIEETLRTSYPDAQLNKGLFERLQDEARWVQDSLKQGPPPS
jgi:hypothetical protein